jgi:hypothetical protein
MWLTYDWKVGAMRRSLKFDSGSCLRWTFFPDDGMRLKSLLCGHNCLGQETLRSDKIRLTDLQGGHPTTVAEQIIPRDLQ